MSRMKWHNGPNFTSGHKFKLGGYQEVAPGAEYERLGRVLTSIEWRSVPFADLAAEFNTDSEFIKSALAHRGFNVVNENDKVSGELVNYIRYLFASRARSKPKNRSIIQRFYKTVTEVNERTREITL